ncbi:hypothetical protein [Mycobacterium botniense]|uniref:Uncharacterized protein n=1 Tax=Mycobacterium botniense TaxID=84962 RepID=A0A7I9XWF2_9MYCO|nr:hypothetical protein [Mycobacterium botniense]GFG74106.1 hypothetical protein MBOT_14710 [Mycobacterium botniense]
MSQVPEPSMPSTPATVPPPLGGPPAKPDRLYQVAAWIVIVSGILLIGVLVLFLVWMIG